MVTSVLQRVPVVAGLAYSERIRQVASSFTATLSAEPGHRYFRQAIAVFAGGEKVGYVAPEVAVRYFEALRAHAGAVTCPARRGTPSDRQTSGVELLLDFTTLDVASSE